jgi:hypothetical protein
MLVVQRQLQDNWCWAACAATVSTFFDAATQWTQCIVVNGELQECTCCDDGDTSACDRPWYLDRALKRTRNLAAPTKGRLKWRDVCAEIDAGRPVGARVGWSGGGGHFVLLTGCTDAGGKRLVSVEDPWSGRSTIAFDDFADRYKGTGRWTHSYLTEA